MSGNGTYQFPFSRYPAVRIVLLLILGVLLGEAFSGGYFLPLGTFGVLVVGLWVLKKMNPQSFLVQHTSYSNLLILFLIIAFGWFRQSTANISKAENNTQKLVSIMPWDQLQFRAVIDSYSRNASGKLRMDVNVVETGFSDFSSKEKYKARVLFDDIQKVSLGDTLSFVGTIIPIQEKRNPNQFDYASFLAEKGIMVQTKLDSLISIKKNTSRWTISWWQNRALKIIERNFEETTEPLAKALLLGFKQELDQDTKKAFSRAGLSHIMAVSGLHVGFVIAPFWFLLPYIRQFKMGKGFGLLLIVLVLLIYAGITGFPASVMRASLTALFLTIGKLFHKSPNSINLTAVAAVILLVFDPNELFNIGFQLSFSAVFIILLILPEIQAGFPYWLRIKWYAKPLMVIVVSIVVQFGLYPLQVYYFGELSVISPIANALFVPLLGLLIPLAITALIISPFSEVIGFWLSTPFDAFLYWMHKFISMTANWSWTWIEIETPSVLIFPFWLVLIFAISGSRIPQLRWKLIIVGLSLLGVLQIQSLINELAPKTLSITYFDVGQGDAALIQTPNGKHLLIDAGMWNPGYNSGRSIILPHLKYEGINKLDAVILSHPHADHIGGILDLIDSIPIDTIYNSGFEYESNLYRSYLELANQKNTAVKSLRAGNSISIDESVLFLVFAPEGGTFNQDPNQHSIVLEVIYGNTEFLFTGDAGENQELRILENYASLLDTDVLKVGHHGSRTSSSEKFISTTSPDISIMSLAESNRFKHPHPEAVQRILESKTELFFTSRDKAIILKSDGKRIWKEEWQ